MLDKNVGDALLKLDLSPPTEAPATQIERIINADRRRVTRWTRISIALWILAALGAILVFIMGQVALAPITSADQSVRLVKILDQVETSSLAPRSLHGVKRCWADPADPRSTTSLASGWGTRVRCARASGTLAGGLRGLSGGFKRIGRHDGRHYT
jgi:hypothetical protein